jgi:hypothetical protein
MFSETDLGSNCRDTGSQETLAVSWEGGGKGSRESTLPVCLSALPDSMVCHSSLWPQPQNLVNPLCSPGGGVFLCLVSSTRDISAFMKLSNA